MKNTKGLSNIILLLVGFASGWLSVYGFNYYDCFPGFIFGSMIGSYFLFFHKKSLPAVLSFIVFSTASFYVAYYSFNFIFSVQIAILNYSPIFALMATSFIGSLLLLLSFRNTIDNIPNKKFLALLFLGTILSLSFFITLPNLNYTYSLFIIWQTIMAGALGWAIKDNKKEQQNKPNMLAVIIIALLIAAVSWQNEKMQSDAVQSPSFTCLGANCQEETNSY